MFLISKSGILTDKKGQNYESISLQKITRTENYRVVKACGFSRLTSDFKLNLHHIAWLCASQVQLVSSSSDASSTVVEGAFSFGIKP